MRLDDRPVMPYQGPSGEQPIRRRFPLGIISLWSGVCAVAGIPIVDAVIRIPLYLQLPILITGAAAGVLAIGTGVGAIVVRAERTRGILGVCFGFVGLMLMLVLARA
jgi:hypothetical protein